MSQSSNSLPLPGDLYDDMDRTSHSTKLELGSPRSKKPPKLRRRCKRPFLKPLEANQISFNGTGSNTPSLNPLEKSNNNITYFSEHFTEVKKLGEGSFAEVFCVKSKDSGLYYAVKRTKEPFIGEHDRLKKLQEVRKHELIPKHDNCVEFIQAWEEQDLLYIQLELCKMSLDEYTRTNHSLADSMLWDILSDLLSAVKHLHDHNLIHLDIKLENILLAMNGRYKLGDFGLVIDLVKDNVADAIEGDAKYLAPELMASQFTKAADVFSLGITMLELASDLELPSRGQLWHQLRNGIFPNERIKHVSPDLMQLIKWMMTPNFGDRPSVDDVLNHPSMSAALDRKDASKNNFPYIPNVCKHMWSVCSGGLSQVKNFFGKILHAADNKNSAKDSVNDNPISAGEIGFGLPSGLNNSPSPTDDSSQLFILQDSSAEEGRINASSVTKRLFSNNSDVEEGGVVSSTPVIAVRVCQNDMETSYSDLDASFENLNSASKSLKKPKSFSTFDSEKNLFESSHAANSSPHMSNLASSSSQSTNPADDSLQNANLTSSSDQMKDAGGSSEWNISGVQWNGTDTRNRSFLRMRPHSKYRVACKAGLDFGKDGYDASESSGNEPVPLVWLYDSLGDVHVKRVSNKRKRLFKTSTAKRLTAPVDRKSSDTNTSETSLSDSPILPNELFFTEPSEPTDWKTKISSSVPAHLPDTPKKRSYPAFFGESTPLSPLQKRLCTELQSCNEKFVFPELKANCVKAGISPRNLLPMFGRCEHKDNEQVEEEKGP